MSWGQEGFVGESLIATLLLDMIDNYPARIFPSNMDFCHFSMVSRTHALATAYVTVSTVLKDVTRWLGFAR